MAEYEKDAFLQTIERRSRRSKALASVDFHGRNLAYLCLWANDLLSTISPFSHNRLSIKPRGMLEFKEILAEEENSIYNAVSTQKSTLRRLCITYPLLLDHCFIPEFLILRLMERSILSAENAYGQFLSDVYRPNFGKQIPDGLASKYLRWAAATLTMGTHHFISQPSRFLDFKRIDYHIAYSLMLSTRRQLIHADESSDSRLLSDMLGKVTNPDTDEMELRSLLDRFVNPETPTAA